MNQVIVYIHSHAAEHFEKIGNLKTRNEINYFIKRLQSNPETKSNYQQPDPKGRMLEIKLIGRQSYYLFQRPLCQYYQNPGY